VRDPTNQTPELRRGDAEMSASGRVGFVGYGRFGRALGERFLDAGVDVRAFDPAGSLPEAVACDSLESLVEGSEFLILAVPVAKTRAVVEQVAPLLSDHQLVMDVGSVKEGPSEALRELLGERISWLATHPLFGPISLSMGERNLRVVVCPNEQHPDAVARAERLYAKVGCELIQQSAAEHDRAMAETHALTYFVAKGFLDAGLELDSPVAPPSVRALRMTIEAVRQDAAHLFVTLNRENEYAKGARRKFVDALLEVDEALNRAPEQSEDEEQAVAALELTQLGEAGEELSDARDVIDELDLELMELLARRVGVARRAAKAKASAGRPVRDPEREAVLLRERVARAEELGLDGASVEEVFQAILSFSRLHQGQDVD